jgi:hypothetical protein
MSKDTSFSGYSTRHQESPDAAAAAAGAASSYTGDFTPQQLPAPVRNVATSAELEHAKERSWKLRKQLSSSTSIYHWSYSSIFLDTKPHKPVQTQATPRTHPRRHAN